MNIRPIAIYLPQFYPIPENDKWWGKGFTEWTNVTKAKPLFSGHYQPHLPSDLGFYDLRLHETMVQQVELAKSYGINGFMFYHYWFSGKRILERPVNQWLEKKTPNFPFCICWANENWTRRWDGMDQEILMIQKYSEEDDRLHFKELVKYFADDRYIKIDGKPLFAVYRTQSFPDIKKTASIWREEALKHGLKGIYLAKMESWANKTNPEDIGFDAAIDFQPDFSTLPDRIFGSFWQRLLNKFNIRENPFQLNRVYDYGSYIEKVKSITKPDYKLFPGLTPMWDNSARRKKDAIIFRGSTPELFGEWCKYVKHNFKPYSEEENFIFINAWNEWAEGNHLEPCMKWGKSYLEQILKLKQ